MGRSQETFNKKEVRSKKEKKRKDKEKKRLAKKENPRANSLDDMIAYVDENGRLTSTPPDPTKKKEVKLESIEVNVPKQEKVEYDPVRQGVVSFFNNEKGFGFIKDSETKESLFVHINNLQEPITEGNLVSFEAETGPKGLIAVKVKQIK